MQAQVGDRDTSILEKQWSLQELGAAVDAYIDMLQHQQSGQPFVKKDYYRALSKEYGRTVKSYEYRMQNISYIYALQGRSWITGLRSARNVGTNVIQTLETLIAEREGQHIAASASFNANVVQLVACA
ncbi:hypothetical protein [Isoalcanivorax beigongshangi]|uniref:Uncharacterized protein n=1 Tax=Isoalcanivorax beigongshangi TaxID=3238810 RepID=A0ABV4ACU2_9GAMM